ncbi:hypothetical protein ELY14_11185 [Legionella septentrionalis]|nr:hypothetical protein ELY14_11185 [Legionella septentrionalis]
MKENQTNPGDYKAKAKANFTRHLIHENAIATNNIKAENFNMEQAKQKSIDAMEALDATGGLQSMLSAQMLSIHELQQRTMTYANASSNLELQKYYTNTAIKLANCFTQQANILAKLQGVGGQKIIVERVDVHQGGQAVVGNIQGGMGKKEKI